MSQIAPPPNTIKEYLNPLQLGLRIKRIGSIPALAGRNLVWAGANSRHAPPHRRRQTYHCHRTGIILFIGSMLFTYLYFFAL